MSIAFSDSGIIELSQNQLDGLVSSQEEDTGHHEENVKMESCPQVVYNHGETNQIKQTSKVQSKNAHHATASAIEKQKGGVVVEQQMIQEGQPRAAAAADLDAAAGNQGKEEEDSWVQPEFSLDDEFSLEIEDKRADQSQSDEEHQTVHEDKNQLMEAKEGVEQSKNEDNIDSEYHSNNLDQMKQADGDEKLAEVEDEEQEDGEQSEDNEDGDELLDQLCDNLEADEYHQKKEEFVQAKNKELDDKLKKIQHQKQIQNEALQEKNISKAMDQRSGLILRKDSRVATEDEISAKAGRRKFLKMEKFDSKEGRDFLHSHGQSQGAYTIGVVVDKSPLKTTSSNNKFAIIKISDLEKYDLNQVKAHLEKTVDKAESQTVMKSFTKNGYKQISIMCFGDAAETIVQYHCGTIWAVLNPKLMKSSKPDDNKYGLTFSIDNESQIQMIGYSEHYSICQGKSSQNSVSQVGQFVNKTFACREFVNKSCETLCDQHKIENKIANFEKFRAGRMNTMGERVDINHINRMRKLEDKEKKLIGFVQTDKSVLNRQQNKPMPIFSQGERDKREALWKKEQGKLGTYFNYRDKKFKLSNGMTDLMQTGLKCQENKFANKTGAGTLEKSSSKMDIHRSKVMAPQNAEEEDGDAGFEIDFGGNDPDIKGNFKKQLLSKFMQKPAPQQPPSSTGGQENISMNLQFAQKNGNKKASLQQMMDRTAEPEKSSINNNLMEKQQQIINNSSTQIRDRLGIRKLKQ